MLLVQSHLTALPIHQVMTLTVHQVPILVNIVIACINTFVHADNVIYYSPTPRRCNSPPVLTENIYLYSNIIAGRLDFITLTKKLSNLEKIVPSPFDCWSNLRLMLSIDCPTMLKPSFIFDSICFIFPYRRKKSFCSSERSWSFSLTLLLLVE